MPLQYVNWLAAIAAALASFVLGGLWYSPVVFGRTWMRENSLGEEQLKQGARYSASHSFFR
jgi:hypothetical protein